MSQPTRSKRTGRHGKGATQPARPAAAASRVKARAAHAAGVPVAAADMTGPSRASALPALPTALEIREIQETFEFLRAAVNCGVDCIDASRVTRVDTAGLQLLLAAGRTAAAHGRTLRWAGASSTLIEAATRLGVAGLLGLARAG